jgi:hypothetical protein
MKLFNQVILSLTLSVLIGCGTPTVSTPGPVAPNSPQTTVALTIKTVADTDLAGVNTVIALRDAGKLSQANTVTIENWLGVVATTDKSLSAILANGQTWAQQKAAILTMLGTVTAPAIATAIDPGAQAVIAQIMTLVAQIKTQVVP